MKPLLPPGPSARTSRLRPAGAGAGALALLLAAPACDRFSRKPEEPKPAAPGAKAPAAAPTPAPGAPTPPGDTTAMTKKTEAPPEARVLSDAFANVAAAIRPSVVRLDVEVGGGQREQLARGPEGAPPMPDLLERFFGGGGMAPPQQAPQRGTGSGVIVDTDGNILTNSHVVKGATRVTISFSDGKKFTGRVIGHDPYTDVGVVRFEKAPPQLTAARLGDSEGLRVGQWVLAVGSPLGLEQTVTAGIVSGIGRSRGVLGQRVRRYIQTDALINPGNSGGPLVNLSGEVVGINTVINVGPGGSYGFAIPISQAADVAKQILSDKEGRVRYPSIGAVVGDVADVPETLRAQVKGLPEKGALVRELVPGGGAARAGMKPGDVITKVGGKAVEGASDLVELVSAQKIGAKVPIEIVRDGRATSLDVTLGELAGPSAGGEAEGGGTIGVALQTLTEPIARSLGLDPRLRGAVVAEVRPGSPAEKAGLEPGDVIREVDRKPVTSAEEVVAAIRAGGAKPHLLRVTNATGTRFVTVTPE
jgi:serine protease Do